MSENLKWSEYDFTKIPFDDLVRVGQRTMLYRDMFTVSWLLGRFCNYKCSYCWPYARSDRKDHRPTELCIHKPVCFATVVSYDPKLHVQVLFLDHAF